MSVECVEHDAQNVKSSVTVWKKPELQIGSAAEVTLVSANFGEDLADLS